MEIVNYLTSPELVRFIFPFKIFFIIFSLILLAFIIFALIKTTWLKRLLLWDLTEISTYRPFGVRKITKLWTKIMARLETGIESEAKLAIIEADSLLDDILKRMGFGGETLGERLKALTPATIPNREEVLEAHQIRNNVVHDPDYRLSLEEARKTLAIYEKALRDLQAF